MTWVAGKPEQRALFVVCPNRRMEPPLRLYIIPKAAPIEPCYRDDKTRGLYTHFLW
jgi:hypothetical protein